MQPIDYLKALGVAVAVLALNMLAVTAAIFAWSMLIEPGRPQAFYAAAAPRIGAWVAPPTGVLLLFVAAWRLGVRRPERNALAFASVAAIAYAAVDVALGLGMATPQALLTPQLALSLAAALAGALVGGALAQRAR